MTENVLFLNMFALYQPSEEHRELLENAAILDAELDPVQRRIELELDCEGPIPGRVLAQICRDVEQAYDLKELCIRPRFPAGALYRMEGADLAELFIRENPICMGSLAGAVWEWEGTALTIRLRANGRKMIEEAIPAVCR